MLFELMLLNLQSKTIFLREQLKLKDNYFKDKVLSLLKRDDNDFLSYREIPNLLQKNRSSLLMKHLGVRLIWVRYSRVYMRKISHLSEILFIPVSLDA